MKFRVRYMTAPGVPHIYCRVFAAPGTDATFAALGNLTMRREEFEAFRMTFDKAEFVAEDSNGKS
jgi:hypothetical protein